MTSGPKSTSEQELSVRVGRLAARLREGRGVSQAALAGELRHDQSFVSRIEHGDRRMSVTELLRWADALGVSFSELSRELRAVWVESVKTESIWQRERRESD